MRNNPLGATDPLGLWTLQIGLAANKNWGFVNGNYSTGIAIDGHFNIATYASGGGGGSSLGASEGFGLSFAGSDARTVYDLGGPFFNTSFTGGDGLGGSLDIFSGYGLDGVTKVTGAGFTLGEETGMSMTSGMTGTLINGINRSPNSIGSQNNGGGSCPNQ